MKGDGAGTGDDGNVGEMGEGTVSAKLGRLLLLVLLSGMTRNSVGASTRCGLVWNSCVVMRSPEAV